MNILIFGAGDTYQYCKKWIGHCNILAILDNSRELHGKYIDGHIIANPTNISEFEYDRVYILSLYVYDIKKQLIGLGVPEEKIFYTFNLIEFFASDYHPFVFHNGKRKSEKKTVIVIPHDFSISGATNCLVPVVDCLLSSDYHVIVASHKYGSMVDVFHQRGADVIVDERLYTSKGDNIEWLDEADVLFINTIELYHLLSHRNSSVPTIWWVHEPPCLYRVVLPELLQYSSLNNLYVYAVSTVANQAFHDRLPFVDTQLMFYGVKDSVASGSHWSRIFHDDNPMNFAIVGPVSKLKGQDILLNAVKKVPSHILKLCRFTCIGVDSSTFACNLKEQVARDNLPIVFLGEKSNQEVLSLLDEMDVLICSSREESLSMAVVEAMMKEIPAILPDQTGMAGLVENNVNGYIYLQDNPSSLSKIIQHCVKSRNDLPQIGRRARKTYLENFSIDRFNEKLHDILLKIK